MARTVKSDSAETKRITALAAIVAGATNDEIDDPEEDDEVVAHPAVKVPSFKNTKSGKAKTANEAKAVKETKVAKAEVATQKKTVKAAKAAEPTTAPKAKKTKPAAKTVVAPKETKSKETPIRLFPAARISGKGKPYLAVSMYEDSRKTGNKGVKLGSICLFDSDLGEKVDTSAYALGAWEAFKASLVPTTKLVKPECTFPIYEGYTVSLKGKEFTVEKDGVFYKFSE